MDIYMDIYMDIWIYGYMDIWIYGVHDEEAHGDATEIKQLLGKLLHMQEENRKLMRERIAEE